MTDDLVSRRFCTHCGSVGAHKLGYCTVCDLAVCERCGNTQHIQGEKQVIHDECLKKGTGGFSMIKFVK